jgi:hypothetical protein
MITSLSEIRPHRRNKLLAQANLLAKLTIGYNLLEGLISMGVGGSDETLALFGFGVDSFIEVISAIGVWHMLQRIRQNQGESRDDFERRALRITGGAFYLLTCGLILMAALNLVQQHEPETTFWGVIIALVSMSFMWLLIHYKTQVGESLDSAAILADAACSKACLYLSVVLLVASAGYEMTGVGSLDAIGALLIAWFSWKEGREALSKARGMECSCSCGRR